VSFITSIPEEESNTLVSSFGIQYLGHLNRRAKWPKNSVRINTMAASLTTEFAVSVVTPVSTSAATSARPRSNRRRITTEAGHALEILGHAIEYLTDELVHRSHDLSSPSGELDAVQLLMALNRQVYYECPEAVTMGARLRSMLHLRAA
jgi:hypothetical protein